MRTNFKSLLLAGILISVTFGCSIKWTDAISYGNVVTKEFKESVDIEIHSKLIIVPVTIDGKEYRFLFDTGAPFSISHKLLREHNFKIISKGNIVDSDHNRTKVNWAQVDSILIGNVTFQGQTAFVGDFAANPIITCLDIDGIIGSNLIRHSNWTIDQEQRTLSLFSSIKKEDFEECITVPFKTDYQYNMFVDIDFGPSRVKNILVDYGSNGSVALSNDIFTTLKNRNVFETKFLETGIKQSGMLGSPVDLRRELTYSDAVKINELELKNVLINTGETTSTGNQFLSRFKVTIDWTNKNLYLTKPEKEIERNGLLGFRLGTSEETGIYILSVIEESNAYKHGVRPNMKVLKIDSLDFENGNGFCDYVNYNPGNEIFIQLLDSLGKKRDAHFKRTYPKN
ncbi:aspartyl protease family protein [Mangrovimonas sp. DI 80]|uniref:aspartyl protease family protein n=1 Tax=Mangrovimonas sp. DI 80 TaxID=1779330 RepID=UPI0009776765|nr:aspartyl protease family protein [Mangrovimonas sp. DI 80]OMP29966.1 hypothetical protein BKM32_15290 [Mangrovimonas sp. DI 80]